MFALIERLLFLLFLISVLRSVLRFVTGFLGGFRGNARRSNPQPGPFQPRSQTGPTPQVSTVLHQDPVCGTYVAVDASLKRICGGKVLHFCSEECRDRYQG